MVSASYITETELTLSWTQANDNVEVSQYKILKDGQVIQTISAFTPWWGLQRPNTTYRVSGLSPNSSYTFKIVAVDASGNLTVGYNPFTGPYYYGPSVSATTLIPLPSKVDNVTATPTDSYVDLSCGSSAWAQGYKVYWGTNQGGPYENEIDVGNVTSYRVGKLENTRRYFFMVRAYNSRGNSPYSDEVSAIPLASPMISGPATSDGTGIRLYGTADPSVGIQIIGGEGNTVATASSDSHGQWHASIDLAPGTWDLSAREVSGEFTSAPSNQIHITIDPTIPVAGDANVTSVGAQFNANPDTGITEATIYRGSAMRIEVPVSNNPRSVAIKFMGQTIELRDANNDGVYSGLITPSLIQCGTYPVQILITDGSGVPYEQLFMQITLIDPSGYVYNYYSEKRESGAIVTLYRYNPSTSAFERMDPDTNAALMTPKRNPLMTDDEGRYGWDVAPGKYKVLVKKDRYEDAWSNEVIIADKPVTDLNVVIKPIDNDAPTTTAKLSSDPNNNGWYNSDVEVTLSAEDSISGVAKTEYSFNGETWRVYSGPLTISNEGTTYVHYRSTDKAGNTEDAPLPLKVYMDKTAPTVTIDAPADGAEYILKEPVTADWNAVDTLSGIESYSGAFASGEKIYTGSVGEKKFTGEAIDLAGNRTVTTIKYYVRYAFSGVFPPINQEKSFKAGNSIPVKFQLKDADGNYVTNSVARLFITAPGSTEARAVSTANSTTENLFRYDSDNNQYIFNLSTKGMGAGTLQLRIQLDDESSKYVSVSLK